MKFPLIFGILALASSSALAQSGHATLRNDYSGYRIGTTTSEAIGFHGTAPSTQRADASQVALTDSTTGTAADTLAAGTGVTTIAIPIQLASMTTAAADLITNYTPGYKFKILSASFTTTTIGAGSGATQVLNFEIGTTNLTGGAITVTLAGTDTLGELTTGTSITAANTGSASDTISLEVAASGTVFTAGAGIILLKVQNMDTADTVASLTDRVNELLTALTGKGLIKGAP